MAFYLIKWKIELKNLKNDFFVIVLKLNSHFSKIFILAEQISDISKSVGDLALVSTLSETTYTLHFPAAFQLCSIIVANLRKFGNFRKLYKIGEMDG